MSDVHDGGPAFAKAAFGTPETGMISWDQNGMSLRDYFAAKALGGILADPTVHVHVDSQGKAATQLASTAYQIADAMIAERARRMAAEAEAAKKAEAKP